MLSFKTVSLVAMDFPARFTQETWNKRRRTPLHPGDSLCRWEGYQWYLVYVENVLVLRGYHVGCFISMFQPALFLVQRTG